MNVNSACVMKLGWSLRQGDNNLWCRVLRGKYGREGSNNNNLLVKPYDSPIWKQLAKIWPILNNNCFWSIGNGLSISVWNDAWILPGIKLADFLTHIPDGLANLRVCDLVGTNGAWDLRCLEAYIPVDLVSKIHALLPPKLDYGDDERLWPGNSLGEFSIASGFHLISNYGVTPINPLWAKVWKIQAPERVKAFVWLLVHDRLLTNSRKNAMGLGSSFCSHCGTVAESTLHALRDCPRALNLWMSLVKIEDRHSFFGGNLMQWLHFNLVEASWNRDGVEWASCWAMGCHLLWSWKNKEEHDVSYIRPLRPWVVVTNCMKEYHAAMIASKLVKDRVMDHVNVRWDPPDDGWLCLNCDGAVKATSKVAGCGGLVRNSAGDWLAGFSKHIGFCDPFVAELWGVFIGLQLVRSKGWDRVVVQMDAKVACHVILGTDGGRISGWSIIREIRKLLQLPWEVRFVSIFREANRCADALANIGCCQSDDLIFYEQCPNSIGPLLLSEAVGNTIPRLVPV